MPVELNDQETERFVLGNQLLTPDQFAPYKERQAVDPSQSLYRKLVAAGVITYEMQMMIEAGRPVAPAPRLDGTQGVLGSPQATLGGAPKLQAQALLLGKPPALAGLQAPVAVHAVDAPIVPPPRVVGVLVPPPKLGGGVVPPPRRVGGLVPPLKVGGSPGSPPPCLALAPTVGVLHSPATPAPVGFKPALQIFTATIPNTGVPAPVAVPAFSAHAASAQVAPAPAQHEAPHSGHTPGHGAVPATKPLGWPGGMAPADPTPGGIQEWLKRARAVLASDIHFNVGRPPMVRIHGDLQPLDPALPLVKAEDTQRLIRQTLTPAQWAFFERGWDLDMCYAFPGGGRYRANIIRERNGDGLVARLIGDRTFSLTELGMPQQAQRLTEFAQGLVLVTGPSGHGKTTTMMALVDLVNLNRPDHIITVEEPIEYMIESKKCHVSQREVGPHTLSFASALKAALRENPDIIVIGELRDYETTSMAINAAETGHLVFASLPTQDAAKTIDKVLDYFPPEEQTQIRLMVSESLRGIISQQLMKKKDGTGRVAAVELLFNSVAVANIIREANTAGLVNAMQLGKNAGMVLMDDSLFALAEKGVIDGTEAWQRSSNKVKFKQWEIKPAAGSAPAASASAAAKPGLPTRR